MRSRWLGLLLVGSIGCQMWTWTRSLPSSPSEGSREVLSTANDTGVLPTVVAASATASLEASALPLASPIDPPDHLALAAVCVENGQPAQAVVHLRHYVRAHPDHAMIRAYLAELLLRQQEHREATWHFEQFIAAAQQLDGPARKHLIHCHTRLMELAQLADDEYRERLHRGIGLYLLAQQHQDLHGQATAFTEQLLGRAAKELSEAQKMRPREAKVHWYLYAVWSQLSQRPAAQTALRAAQQWADLSDLTPTERRDLALASSATLPLLGRSVKAR